MTHGFFGMGYLRKLRKQIEDLNHDLWRFAYIYGDLPNDTYSFGENDPFIDDCPMKNGGVL